MTDKKREEILKKAKQILFDTEMVKAILSGRKTQTRRAIKPQPICYDSNITLEPHNNDFFLSAEKHWLRCRVCGHDPEYSREGCDISHHWSQPYCPGDILYVRETFAKMNCNECNADATDCESAVERNGLTIFCSGEMYVYKATDLLPDGIKWRPSIHMPKEAARIFLRVTDVRVERLQDINGYGILAEGVDNGKSNPTMGARWDNMQLMAFSELWNSTVKKSDFDRYGWDANPWVWVIELERVEVTDNG